MPSVVFDIEYQMYSYLLVTSRRSGVLAVPKVLEGPVLKQLTELQVSGILPLRIPVASIEDHRVCVIPRYLITVLVPRGSVK